MRSELAPNDREVSQMDEVAAPLDDPDELQVDKEFRDLATNKKRWHHASARAEALGNNPNEVRARIRETLLEGL